MQARLAKLSLDIAMNEKYTGMFVKGFYSRLSQDTIGWNRREHIRTDLLFRQLILGTTPSISPPQDFFLQRSCIIQGTFLLFIAINLEVWPGGGAKVANFPAHLRSLWQRPYAKHRSRLRGIRNPRGN